MTGFRGCFPESKGDSRDGRIPLVFVEAENIPEAHYKAVEAVWKKGASKRTQYDLKDEAGNYLHPPSKDTQGIVRINNPFAQPRFPPLSFCERGKYILEILGVKNQMVLPRDILLKGINEGDSTEWPYAYNQRLAEFPAEEGLINQVENVIDRLVDDYNSRRSVMTTRSPEIDTKLKMDIPCLGEVGFRCFEDERGKYFLNMTTVWRSRDLFKAWADNVIAVTYWGRDIANRLGERLEREVELGGYTDFSYSLHIYGQDFAQVKGVDGERKGFFEVFPDVDSYISRSTDSGTAKSIEILPQMRDMLSEGERAQWRMSNRQIQLIKEAISSLEKGILP